MTVREIQVHLEEMCGAEVSSTLISTVTDAVMDEAKAWQSRPIDALYPCLSGRHPRQIQRRWGVMAHLIHFQLEFFPDREKGVRQLAHMNRQDNY
jgi:hypothetical protein